MADAERDEATCDKPTPATPSPVEDRRSTLRTLVILGSAAYATALAVPAARFLAASAEGRGAGGARWIRIGRLADLAEGAPHRVEIRADERDAFTLTPAQTLGSVWVQRRGEHVTALSATCPHLGCAVDLRADQQSFGCPCHASRFTLDGAPEAGPSPRALDPLDARVVDGVVEVDFRRYRQGLGERREVGA